jgi:hypothetical protein
MEIIGVKKAVVAAWCSAGWQDMAYDGVRKE